MGCGSWESVWGRMTGPAELPHDQIEDSDRRSATGLRDFYVTRSEMMRWHCIGAWVLVRLWG